MTEPQKNLSKETSKEQLGVIFQPKNLLNTVASGIPGTSWLVEIQNQLERRKVEKRLKALETIDLELSAKLHKVEQSQPREAIPTQDWPQAVGQYMARMVDISVVYDAKFHSPSESGRELFLVVGHGCFVAAQTILTCSEAITMANILAAKRKGRIVIISADMAWHDFEIEEDDDKCSRLVTCYLTRRDEERFEKVKRAFVVDGVSLGYTVPIESSIVSTMTPWIGQEIGFLHRGEATDICTVLSEFQFDSTTISHFRGPSDFAMKSFTTGVLPGRILYTGSPVFDKKGTLLGVIADTESYPSDAGRRAAVKCLIGHHRFTMFDRKQ